MVTTKVATKKSNHRGKVKEYHMSRVMHWRYKWVISTLGYKLKHMSIHVKRLSDIICNMSRFKLWTQIEANQPL